MRIPPDPTCVGCGPYGHGVHHQRCTYMEWLAGTLPDLRVADLNGWAA